MKKTLVKMKLSDLVPYENNPRKNDKSVDMVVESIEQVGYNNPIIVDENHVILAGHVRLKSLLKRKEKEAEVLIVEGLTEEQKKIYRLMDNKAGEFSDWDFELLMDEISGIDWGDLDIKWGDFGIEEKPKEKKPKEEKFKYKCPECGFEFNG